MIFALLMTSVPASLTAPNQVVVFPDRAQVTRVATVVCGLRTNVHFEGIPPSAGADSFRARISEGTVDGLRAELVTQDEQFAPKIEALHKKLEALHDEGRALADTVRRAQQQQQTASRLGELTAAAISREMVHDKPDFKAWQVALDATLTASVAASNSDANAGQQLRDLARREEDLRAELAVAESGSSKQSHVVDVLVSCPAGAKAEVALSYVVGGASWVPVYEARGDGVGTVEFSTYATVRQVTGEEWADVDLVLSTAVPAQNATPPELQKLLVSATERAPVRKVLVRRDEQVDGLRAGDVGEASAVGSGVRAQSQGLSVQLQVPRKNRIAGDGAPARVFIGRASLKAKFELLTAPRLVPVAFRVAQLTNTLEWPVLPGRVDVFGPTGLVGRYELERVAQGAAFELTFGLDDSIRVKRTVMHELKRDEGLFGGKKRFTYSYRFELANYGPAKVDLAVVDQLPVAEVDDIAVTVAEKTTPGYELGRGTGVAKWKVPLNRQERKNLDFEFRVDVPKSYESDGL